MTLQKLTLLCLTHVCLSQWNIVVQSMFPNQMCRLNRKEWKTGKDIIVPITFRGKWLLGFMIYSVDVINIIQVFTSLYQNANIYHNPARIFLWFLLFTEEKYCFLLFWGLNSNQNRQDAVFIYQLVCLWLLHWLLRNSIKQQFVQTFSTTLNVSSNQYRLGYYSWLQLFWCFSVVPYSYRIYRTFLSYILHRVSNIVYRNSYNVNLIT